MEEKLELQKGVFKDESLVIQKIKNHLDSIRPAVIKARRRTNNKLRSKFISRILWF